MPDSPSLLVTVSVLTLLTIQSEFWYSIQRSCLNSVLRPRECTDIADWVRLTEIFVPSFSFVSSTPENASQRIMMKPIKLHNSNHDVVVSMYADTIIVANMSVARYGRDAVNGDL